MCLVPQKMHTLCTLLIISIASTAYYFYFFYLDRDAVYRSRFQFINSTSSRSLEIIGKFLEGSKCVNNHKK